MNTIKMLHTAAAILALSISLPIQGLAQWELEIVAAGGSGNAWGIADLDGDGDIDLTYNHLLNQQTLWFENSPTGWTENLIDAAGPFTVAQISGGFCWDMDQDGDQDFVHLQFTQPSVVVWYENILNGALWIKNVISDNIGMLANMFGNVADLDGDEDLDIAIIDNGNGMVVWIENTGGGLNWVKHDIAPFTPFQGRWLTVMDVDGDNDAEVIFTMNDSVFYFENRLPQTSWPKTAIGASLNGSFFGRGADIDRDGDYDVVASGFNANQLAWYENPSWELRIIANDSPQPLLGPVGDLDGDGDIDVAAGENGGLAWYENLGNSMNWQRRIIATGEDGRFQALGTADENGLVDIDQDGNIDIVASASVGDLRWYANPGVISGIDEEVDAKVPMAFHLAQNYPNPFNPSTEIRYSLAQAELVNLTVFNVLGEEVVQLVHESKAVGEHSVLWTPQNLPSGVYVYRLQAGAFVEMRKAVFMK